MQAGGDLIHAIDVRPTVSETFSNERKENHLAAFAGRAATRRSREDVSALSALADMSVAVHRVAAPSARALSTSRRVSTRESNRPATRVPPARDRRTNNASGRGALHVAAATKQTYASFDDMIAQSPVPVLVDFYATWCGPCQLLSKQVFPQLAAAVGRDKVSLVKIDTEKYPNIASKFGVEALPTIILFKDGEILDRIEGLPDANQLRDRLLYMLGGA